MLLFIKLVGDYMQRYFAHKISNDKIILDAGDWHHIRNVMRMKVNDRIEVVYNNKLYLCLINSLDDEELSIAEERDCINNKKVEIVFIIPFLRDNKISLIIEKATELGVDEIIVVNMEHSIIRLDDNKINAKKIRWERIAKEASEQSKRMTIPKIKICDKLSDLNVSGRKVFCNPKEKYLNLKKYLKKEGDCAKLNVVVGPEGGFSSFEEDLLLKMGFDSVSLGDNVLRVETVPLSVLSMINYEYME